MGHERFWSKTERGANGCILWTGVTVKSAGREDFRYGRFTTGGKKILAHRYAYMISRGPIPRGFLVCHSCDTPRCVNPDHLFIGTQRDNVMDAARKGRMSTPRTGLNRPPRKVSKLGLIEIRAAVARGQTTTSLAKMYGVSAGWVSRAARGIYRKGG